jgi:hypothetical protein
LRHHICHKLETMHTKAIHPILIITSILLFSFAPSGGEKYRTQSGTAYFYSKAPIEDIEATSNNLVGILDPNTNKFAFAIIINTFKFKNSLMQKHFNEDYMESDKFPKAIFSGEILENLDLSKDTSMPVTLKGKLNIHGVEKERELPGHISLKSGKLNFNSSFPVALKDHDIKVPKLLIKNIAEVIDVQVSGTMELK